ncbi:hypothetical protein ACQ859_21085 [Roseateles chitinivorans]|uniref:hypothetical protein n=1 Tax=Roseateles chitinivorans TaxID=2917965 RepID=UPI003D673FB7
MNIQPSLGTAAAAGAWLALWGVPFELWLDKQEGLSTLQSNLLLLGFGLFFFLLPAYFFVLGRGEPFEWDWMFDPEERARQAVLVKRMGAWFLSGGVVMAIWSIFLPTTG